MFNMQYASYLSIVYTYIRIPSFIDSTGKIDFLFEQLFNYKQHQSLTWFHYACYQSLKKDKTGAIESLKKSLQLGFGNYFMLTCDNDLALIRDLPEFITLVLKYFPGESQKTRSANKFLKDTFAR